MTVDDLLAQTCRVLGEVKQLKRDLQEFRAEQRGECLEEPPDPLDWAALCRVRGQTLAERFVRIAPGDPPDDLTADETTGCDPDALRDEAVRDGLVLAHNGGRGA